MSRLPCAVSVSRGSAHFCFVWVMPDLRQAGLAAGAIATATMWNERPRQQQRTFEVAPRRGVLYDRNLHELAMTVLVDSVYAVPSEISDKEGSQRQRPCAPTSCTPIPPTASLSARRSTLV